MSLVNVKDLAQVQLIYTQVNNQTKAAILHIRLNKAIEPSHVKDFVDAVRSLTQNLIENEVNVMILSGAGPIWLYCALLHELVHLFGVIATFDPKLRAAVVVSSHVLEVEKGQLLTLPNEVIAQLVQK